MLRRCLWFRLTVLQRRLEVSQRRLCRSERVIVFTVSLLIVYGSLFVHFNPGHREACGLQKQVECGFPGITEQTCLAVGCCFIKSFGRSRCVAKAVDMLHEPKQVEKVCVHIATGKYECGGNDITAQDCNARGCCYSPEQSPLCHFPIGLARPYNTHSLADPEFQGPLVSVVMPCYKQEEYIATAIESVVAQSFTNWELLVVDDGTPDFSCAARARHVLEYLNRPDIAAFVLEKPNGGLSDARNFGISHSRGAYLAMLDADDVLWPNYLLNVAEAISYHPDLDLIYADQAFFGIPGAHPLWYLVPNQTIDYASQRGPLPVISVYSRRIYNRARGYRIDMIYGNEDYVYWLDLLQLGARSRKIEGISSWYRLKQNSMRTDSGYVALAPAMTVSHNPYVYGLSDPDRVCYAMGEIFCKMHAAPDAVRLYEATVKQPFSCYGWLWLALFKLHSSCSADALSTVERGLAACSGPDASGSTSAHIAQLVILRTWLLSHRDPSHAEFFAQSHRDCSDGLDQRKCHACILEFVNNFDCTRTLHFLLRMPEPSFPASFGSVGKGGAPIHEQMREMVAVALRRSPPPLNTPRLIHFIYGLGNDAFPKFHMYHYIALRSAYEVNAPANIMFHCAHEPRGFWWEQALEFVTVVHVEPPFEHEGRCLAHHAHKADVLRLKVLARYGGVYMDIDTVSLRPWASLFGNEFVMAWQDSPAAGTVRHGKTYGLCNAAMIAVPGSRFVELWLKSYAFFRSHGRDRFWDEHSVILPANLTEEYPELLNQGLITTMHASTMWLPLWTTINSELFGQTSVPRFFSYAEVLNHFSRSYMIHLWVSGDAPHVARLHEFERTTKWYSSTRYGAIARLYVEPTAAPGFGGASRRFRPRHFNASTGLHHFLRFFPG